MIGSLSLMAHQPLPGYEPLPDFPEEQPDSSVRDVDELEGWSGSRTTVMESGFGSDSRYRPDSRFSGASTALSGIEAMGSASHYAPAIAKKKGAEYDLDAFYDESEEEEESSEEESSEEEESEEEEEEEEEEESSDEETDSDDSGLSSGDEDVPVQTQRYKK
jgi:AP-3 complex subunit beta